jgi:hypothetical protein
VTVRTQVTESFDASLSAVAAENGGQILPSGKVQWLFDQKPGVTDDLKYLVRLPALAGQYAATTEVAIVQASGAKVLGTYPLTITLTGGKAEIAASAWNLASNLPVSQCDRTRRDKILLLLTNVELNLGRNVWDQERAISDLLAAVDQVRGIDKVDTSELRLAIDQLLGYWEATR